MSCLTNSTTNSCNILEKIYIGDKEIYLRDIRLDKDNVKQRFNFIYDIIEFFYQGKSKGSFVLGKHSTEEERKSFADKRKITYDRWVINGCADSKKLTNEIKNYIATTNSVYLV